MNERLTTGRFLVLSAAFHAAAFGVLGTVLVTRSGPEPVSRVDVAVAVETTLEAPLPVLPSTGDATIPEGPAPAESPDLVEAAAAEETGDPRFAAPFGGTGEGAPGEPGIVGLGAGGFRRGALKVAAAPPAAPEPEPDPEPAPAPEPPVRARPVPRTCPAPEYPARERRLGIEGVVDVLVRVSAAGEVESAEVEATSGNEALDGAAVAAVLRWRFEPAPAGGVVVQRFRFLLVSAALSRR